MRRILTVLTTALCLGAAGLASAAGSAPGTTISNVGYLDLNDGVSTSTLQTTPVVVTVQQLYALSVGPDGTVGTPGQTVNTFPGQASALTYTLTNTGNGSDVFSVSAATAGGGASAAAVQGVYRDANGNGVYDAADTLVTTVSLAADASATLFVVYVTPVGTASGSQPLLNLTATSQGNTGVSDTNNVGRFAVGRQIDLLLGTTASDVTGPAQNYVFTDRLDNTGNTTLLASEITLAVTRAATNAGTPITDNFTVNYQVTGPGGTFTGANLETVADQAIGAGLAAGQSLDVTVTVTTAASSVDADRLSLAISAFSGVSSGAGVSNQALSSDPQGQITNTLTIQRGVGTVNKTVASCGTTYLSCGTSGGAGPVAGTPGTYVIYFLTATNTGTGNLFNVRLRDVLPADFVPTHVGARTTAAGTLVFSLDGNTWVTDPATLGVVSGGSSTLYVSVENAAPGTSITLADTFSGGSTLRMSIAGYIRSGAVTGSVLTRDDSKLP